MSILSCKFPIFAANDDVEALMEIAAIVGKGRMEKCARLHSEFETSAVPLICVDESIFSQTELSPPTSLLSITMV